MYSNNYDAHAMEVFEGDPKVTITLDHWYIEASLSIKVHAQLYPVITGLSLDNAEVRRDLFCQAVALSAQSIAQKLAEAHLSFEESYQSAQTKARSLDID